MKQFEVKQLNRSVSIREASIDAEKRTVDLVFSSEEPVDRWFGTEILDHDPASVRLGRLQNAGPLLMDHSTRDHVGVVESASVGKDRVGRALVRFGNSERAAEVFQDVIDGIRQHISVGYRIYKGLEDHEEDEVRIVDWEPMEISIVSVPADATVGIGRADDFENTFNIADRSNQIWTQKRKLNSISKRQIVKRMITTNQLKLS